jgi:hypothetical protein
MAVRPEDLTVDFRSLMKMTVQDRVKLAKADPSYLASLTPTQYAMLFPSYYRKDLPDRGLTAATSGATPISTIDRAGDTATPLPRFDGTTAKPGPEAPAPKEKPKPSPGLKESWDQRLLREAEEKEKAKTKTTKSVSDLGEESQNAHKKRVNVDPSLGPASVRYNNPGASYPSPKDNKYGLEGYGIIGGGHKIGKYPSVVHGAASNFDLWSRVYVGKTLQAAVNLWRGNNGSLNVPEGFDPKMILTPELARDKDFMLSFFKGMAKHEAGRKLEITEDEWNEAFDMFSAGGINNYKEQRRKNVEEATEVVPPAKQQPGVIPPRDEGTIGPVESRKPLTIPEGLRPEIVKQLESMNEERRNKVLQAMQNVTPDEINQYYTEGEDTATPEVVREKTGDILSNPNLIGEEVVIEDQKNKRRLAIQSNLKDQIEEAVTAVYGPGYKARVYSGGQDPRDPSTMPEGASTRHNYGNAADVYIEGPDGRRLTREEQLPLAQYWMSSGYGSIGLGMKGHGMHIDNDQRKNEWGYKGSSNSYSYLTRKEKQALAEAKEKGFQPKYEQFVGFADRVKQIESEQKVSRDEARTIARNEIKKQIETQAIPEAPPVESIETRPQPNVIGEPIPQPSGPSGSSIIPEEKTSVVETKPPVVQPQPSAAPVNPPYSPAVGAAMANVRPPGPNQKDYREDPVVKQENAPTATPTQTAPPAPEPTPEPPKEEPKKMQYGGTKQSPTGEPIGAVDMKTGKLMFTHQPGESVNYDKSGQIKVTPNQRRDSQEIESLAQRVRDEVRLDSEAREEAAKTQTSQMAPNPVVNRDWPDTVKALSQESSHIYKTPSSARAFDQARFSGRKDMFSLGEANLKV